MTRLEQGSKVDYSKLINLSTVNHDINLRAPLIMKVLYHNSDFRDLYLFDTPYHFDSYVFSHSNRCLLLELLTRCPTDQVANLGNNSFKTHDYFEQQLSRYCGSTERPNNQLTNCRPWDVALCVVMKVETVDKHTLHDPLSFLLKRECAILKHVWDTHLSDGFSLDEMTGIPMLFDYERIRVSAFKLEKAETPYQFDIYGTLVPVDIKSGGCKSCLSYLTVEKLGPSLDYLNDLMRASTVRRSFSCYSALRLFDQLLCRCLQLHRLGVVHRAVEPRNINFGRGNCLNVVYLSNFSKAAVIDEFDPNAFDKGSLDRCLVSSHRFSSRGILPGAGSHPYYDIESAFYTLLFLLLNRLPWDSQLRKAEKAEAMAARGRKDGHHTIDVLPNVQEVKKRFWFSGNDAINSVLSNLQLVCDCKSHSLLAEILSQLHSKISELLGSKCCASTRKSLLNPKSIEYKKYIDLRRIVQLYFQVDTISADINNEDLKGNSQRLERDADSGMKRNLWDMNDWCFNYITILNKKSNNRSNAKISFAF